MPSKKKQLVPLRARVSFHAGTRFVRRGQLVRSDDDVVKGREHLFADVNEGLGIEQATAAPGEVRDVAIGDES